MDDLISKASVCEILADIYPTDGEKVVAVKEIDKAYETILNLPSAQPEQIARDIATIIENEQDMRVLLKNTERTEKHDLVSRQAAIDATWFEPSYTDPLNVLTEVRDRLKALPSAQPEPIKINIDDFNKEDLERFKKELRNTPITVLPAQPEIIRCKDCRYYQDNNDGYPHINCKWDANETPDADDFCSGAERRTDE